jgi:(1->4)-alpha-D-glucan 1-alpha-D-glucosylmutase
MADVFTQGDYEPLDVTGPHADHVIAFARRHGRDAVIVVIGRSFGELTQGGRSWPATDAIDARVLAPGYLIEGTENGEAGMAVAGLLKGMPVALIKAQAPAVAARTRSTRLQ